MHGFPSEIAIPGLGVAMPSTQVTLAELTLWLEERFNLDLEWTETVLFGPDGFIQATGGMDGRDEDRDLTPWELKMPEALQTFLYTCAMRLRRPVQATYGKSPNLDVTYPVQDLMGRPYGEFYKELTDVFQMSWPADTTSTVFSAGDEVEWSALGFIRSISAPYSQRPPYTVVRYEPSRKMHDPTRRGLHPAADIQSAQVHIVIDGEERSFAAEYLVLHASV